MGRLKIVQVGFMNANRLFELFYVFRASLTEGGLSLPITLFAFFRRGVNWFAATLPLRLLSLLGSGIGRGVGLVLVPIRARCSGRVGNVSGLVAVEVGVEVVVVLVLRWIRLIDGHLVGHAFPRLGLRDDAAVWQTPQRLKTEKLLRRRGGTSRRRRAQMSSLEQVCARWVFALRALRAQRGRDTGRVGGPRGVSAGGRGLGGRVYGAYQWDVADLGDCDSRKT